MKYDNQLRYAARIISEYDGRAPLAIWLKDFFRANTQMGSSDRRVVSSMVYAYFRLGHSHYPSVRERLLAAIKLSPNLQHISQYFSGEDSTSGQPDQKKDLISSIDPGAVFPWTKQLSDEIDGEALARSFLVQPDLFLRIRPGFRDTVVTKLTAAGVAFSLSGEDCIRLPNSTPVDNILALDSEAVVQDLNSQKTGSLVRVAAARLRAVSESKINIWDCCAASGGKTIMVSDLAQPLDITVSDIRPSIISNLRQRFARAGIHSHRSFIADLASGDKGLPADKYDLIIADLPCTGSGTWSRTPEQLYFFTEEKIEGYARLQRNILETVAPFVKKGGFLLYITCSVFRRENEDAVLFARQKLNLTLVEQHIFAGYHEKADTLFGALLTS